MCLKPCFGWAGKVIDLSYEDKQGYKMFLDQPTINHKAVIFGAGHINQYLVDVLAMLDYEVTVVDDRPDFANRPRFPKAKRVEAKGRFYCSLSSFMLNWWKRLWSGKM